MSVTTDMRDIDAARLAAISTWIDEYPPNAARDPEANMLIRVTKVGEEYGEAVAAMVGAMDQNPRKGATHALDDVRKELLDVALTALAAFEHLTGNDGHSMAALTEHIHAVYTRAGLNE